MAATGRAGSTRGRTRHGVVSWQGCCICPSLSPPSPTEREEQGLSFKEPAHVRWQHPQSGPELSPEPMLLFHFFRPPLPFAPGPSESLNRPAKFLPIYAGYPFLPPLSPLPVSSKHQGANFQKAFFGSQYGNPPRFLRCFLNPVSSDHVISMATQSWSSKPVATLPPLPSVLPPGRQRLCWRLPLRAWQGFPLTSLPFQAWVPEGQDCVFLSVCPSHNLV